LGANETIFVVSYFPAIGSASPVWHWTFAINTGDTKLIF